MLGSPRLVQIVLLITLTGAASLLGAPSVAAQQDRSAVVLVLGQDPVAPIPTLIEATAAQDVADQLFLRLAVPGPTIATGLEKTFRPQLASSWTRRDSVTLVFTLDKRARWHDGVPFTSRDVVFSFDRARNPKLAPSTARLLTQISSVTADDEHTVTMKFVRPYSEQFYDATFVVQPLPAHVLDTIPPEKLLGSSFAQHPVGNGPYRWSRSEPGQFVELAANADFFLGKPGPSRIVFRVASDPEARLNLLLSGEANGLEAIAPPLENRDRVLASGRARVIAVPSYAIVYFLFNEKARGDKSKLHPLFADSVLRRALVIALDRPAIAKAVWGPYATVPIGPVPQMSWIRDGGEHTPKPDLTTARGLLAARGWRDSDGDGILDRDGQKLSFSLMAPASSFVRRQAALLAQAQWKALGVDVQVDVVDRATQGGRVSKADFDMVANSATMDPTPSGLVGSWSCAGIGGTNVGSYCDPLVDSLIAEARFKSKDPLKTWRQLAHTIDADVPAVFIAAPSIVLGVGTQFDNVTIVPWSFWSAAWTWRVKRGAAAP